MNEEFEDSLKNLLGSDIDPETGDPTFATYNAALRLIKPMLRKVVDETYEEAVRTERNMKYEPVGTEFIYSDDNERDLEGLYKQFNIK